MANFPNVTVPEGSSCNITGVVKTEKGGTAIGSASISAATLQLNNLNTDAVIRAAGSIAADIDVSGNLNTVITAAENKTYTETKNYEYHVATIRITGTSGDGKVVTIVQSVFIKVTNNKYQVST